MSEFKGPPKKGPTLPLIGKGYVQANITEIRRIFAAFRFRLERVALAENRVEVHGEILSERLTARAADPANKKLEQRVAVADKNYKRMELRLKNARDWAVFTDERLALYLGYALTHTLKNSTPQAKAVWGELRLLEQQRKWEKAHRSSTSFVAFLKKNKKAA